MKPCQPHCYYGAAALLVAIVALVARGHGGPWPAAAVLEPGPLALLGLAAVGLVSYRQQGMRVLRDGIAVVLVLLTAVVMLLQWTGGSANASAHWAARLGPLGAAGSMSSSAVMLALSLGGMALLALPRIQSFGAIVALKSIATAIVCVAAVDVLGSALDDVPLYDDGAATTLGRLPLAFGLLLIGLGIHRATSATPRLAACYHAREDGKIFVVGMGLFVLTSLVTGMVVIGIVGRYAMTNYQSELLASFRSTSELFDGSVTTAAARSGEIVRLSRLAALVAAGADDGQLNEELQRVATIADYADMASMTVVTPARVLARVGEPQRASQYGTALPAVRGARLLWDGRWHVLTNIALGMQGGQPVRLEVDVILRRFNRHYLRMHAAGQSREMRVCTADDGQMRCFPSRLSPRASSFSLAPQGGRPMAMHLSLAGRQGVAQVLDYRGKSVVAAYGTVGSIGLVHKIDADELYGPLRRQLWLALLGLALVVLAGAVILYRKTLPLVSQLVRARARLDATLGNVPAGIVTLVANGRIVSANQFAADLFGCAPTALCDTMLGQWLADIQQPGALERPGVHELSGRRRDGSTFCASVIISAFMLDQESKRIAIIQDVSERRRAQMLLNKWGRAFAHAGWGVAIVSSDGQTLEMVNPAFAAMHGHTVDELTGQRSASLDAGGAGFGPDSARIERVHVRQDGTTFPVWLDVTAVRDQPDGQAYLVVNVLDISARKRMEQDLEQSAGLLRHILDTLPVGVCVIDRDGQVILTNPTAARIWPCHDCAAVQCDGLRTAALVPSLGGVERALTHGETTLSEPLEMHCQGLRRILSNSVAPLRDDNGDITGAVLVGEDITNTRQAEEALRKSEASLSNAQRIARLGSWDRDIATGIQTWSKETYRIFELDPGAPAPDFNAVLALVVPADRDRLQAASYDAVRKRAAYDIEFAVLLGEGRSKILRSIAQVTYGADVGDIRLVGIVQDVTETKLAEELLRKREQEFRALVENAPDCIVRVDRELRCMYVNPALERTIGMPRAALIGKTLDEIGMDPALTDQAGAAVGQVLDCGQTVTFELVPTRRADRCYQVRLVPELSHAGTVATVLAVARDISAIKASEQRLYGITTNTPGMVFQCVRDAAGDRLWFSYASEGAANLFGLPGVRVETDQDALRAQIAPDDWAALRASLARSAATLTGLNWEGRAWRVSGESIWVNCRATPRPGGDGRTIWEGVMFNITDSKRTEDELRQSRQMLRALSAHREAAREQERKRIAREVHDELGQSLTALRMDVSLMRVHFGHSHPEFKERIGAMKDAVDRTIHIVRDITTTLRPASLDVGLTAALEWLVHDFQRRSAIACHLQAEETGVVLDEERATALFRITQESLTNVAKHAGATRVEISLRIDGQQVCLRVRDDGRGFDAAIPRRADAFGLVGMQERVHMLGGALEITSADGAGVWVQVVLPLDAEEAVQADWNSLRLN